jgi:photosystem II stability/assembly factor-like uncharacterized protein
MQVFRITLLLTVSVLAAAQSTIPSKTPWQMQESGTTAGLRGIYSVDGTVAWASGSGGTVLKTIDGGAHWTQCAVPDAAKDGATLDYRGVQAWDAKTAIVMASGPGEKSRLYKTIDGCKTWIVLLSNEDMEGFWDALKLWTPKDGFLAGDPVDGHPLLSEFTSYNGVFLDNSLYDLKANIGESSFAASNSSIALAPFQTQDGKSREVWFATGGKSGSRVVHYQHFNGGEPERVSESISEAPMFPRSESSGIFSLDYRPPQGLPTEVFLKGGRTIYIDHSMLMAVGGDYTKLNESNGTAAWSSDSGRTWTASTTPPHGFRSAVQWSEALKLWITVGTNGSDVSRDDGKTWQPLDDGNWNALSLPFVVGPNGCIARLNPDALP